MSHDPGHENPQGDSNDPNKKSGWIENLAQQSSGLPQERQQAEARSTLWSYAGKGVQFGGTTALMAFVGILVDRKWGWTPWGFVAFSTIGFVGGIYLLIKDALKQDKGEKK